MADSGMERAVVLLSGGVDSATLLHYVARRLGVPEVHALSIVYGQKHARELEMARWQAAAAGVASHRVLDLSCFADLTRGGSALTDAALPVPDLSDLSDETRRQPPTYVPHRNLVLLALACAMAESLRAGDVFYGAQAQDEYGYWDCTEEFVARLNGLLSLNRGTAVRVRGPFCGRSKAEVVKIGLELGVDYRHTWTCYRGEEEPCGSCPSCAERAGAFRQLGIDDPLATR
jgi:7-cyano-7-deazaguanine synthase